MVAIRNSNTNVPHVFRYPKWEQGIFYPAGSLVSYPASGIIDSDESYWNFYTSLRDVQTTESPPGNNPNWAIFYDAATAASDSELLMQVDELEKNHDSDIKRAVHDYLSNDSDLAARIAEYIRDSEIYARRIFIGDNDSDSGMLEWNPDDGTVDLTLNNEVTLQIGQEQVFYGKAQGAIANGEAVMFAGAQGDHLLFTKADMQSPGFRDEYVIGVATQSLANNQFGFVTTTGKVRDLNTSEFAEGALLYLDPTQAGRLIDSEPTSPEQVILIAAVTRSHNNHGTIFVRPTFSRRLNELNDVLISTVTEGEIISWNDSDKVWENRTANNLIGSVWDYSYF